MSSKREWSRGSLVLRSALFTPAVRIVVVEAWAWEGKETLGERVAGCNYRILPVVAVARDYVANYRHASPEAYLDAATHEHAAERGWVFTGTHDDYEPVVFASYDGGSPECFPLSLCDSSNGVLRQTLCPWPHAEDGLLLKPAVRDALARLRRRLELQDSKPSAAVLDAISRRLADVEARGVCSDTSED
jgi:hypothetical protein